MKKRKLVFLPLFALTAIILCIAICSAAPAALDETAAENAAVCDTLIGAENVCLSISSYPGEAPSTADLSESELQEEIDRYNDQVEQYYSLENPCRNVYQQEHEHLLRQVYQTPTSYRVDGGVLNYKVTDLTFSEDHTTAVISMSYVGYNKWVDWTEDGSYSITCCANSMEVTAKMVKEDGVWKLKEHIQSNITDSWTPQDPVITRGTHSLLASQQAEAQTAAALAGQQYAAFEDALAAAKQIHVEDICPLSTN